jgi:small subunit ribosomal protein S6e
MAVFKVVISEPKSRKSFQTEVDQSKVIGLIGKKIGDEFTGDMVGLAGYGLQITGGTDKDGFPMHPAIKGSGRKKALMTEPPGYRPTSKGVRRRKTLRGNTISDAIVQINAKIVKMGEKPFEQLIPKKEKKEESKEETKEEKKEKPSEKPTEKPAEKPVKKPAEKPAEKPKEEKKEVKKEEKKAEGAKI